MADKRMFSKKIIDTDAFLDMSISARLLYYDLNMRADDDGFVSAPKKILRIVGASEDDMRILIAKKFIIPFDDGVVVIRHWRMHNYIRKDTYTETTYKEHKAVLEFDENKAYMLPEEVANCMLVHEPVTNPSRLVDAEKGREEKERKEKKKESSASHFTPPTLKEVEEYVFSRNSPVDPVSFFNYYESGDWKDKDGKPVKNWKQKLITWESYEKKKSGGVTDRPVHSVSNDLAIYDSILRKA